MSFHFHTDRHAFAGWPDDRRYECRVVLNGAEKIGHLALFVHHVVREEQPPRAQPRKDQTYQITDNFSWLKGKHTFKIGYEGRKFQVWNPFNARNNGSFSFATSGKYSTGIGSTSGLNF